MNIRLSETRQRTLTNLMIDGAMFIAFLIATAPRFTGVPIHEWLGVALGAAVMTHLIVHWTWIVGVARQFFRRATGSARINYVLNVLLFVIFTVIIFTGFMISETVLPWLGIRFERDRFWTQLHHLVSDASIFLIGLHIAVHWRWIVDTVRRLPRFFRPAASRVAAPVLTQEER